MRIPLAAFLCLGACVAMASPIKPLARGGHAPEPCAVTIDFGSYCCGTDQPLEERIRHAVIAEPRVIRAYEWPWGLEGETTLCLVTRTAADAQALTEAYGAWAKAGAGRGPTTVRRGP